MFLKIGAWPNAYKKKTDDANVRTILEVLFTFRFETFVSEEYIFLIFLELI